MCHLLIRVVERDFRPVDVKNSGAFGSLQIWIQDCWYVHANGPGVKIGEALLGLVILVLVLRSPNEFGMKIFCAHDWKMKKYVCKCVIMYGFWRTLWWRRIAKQLTVQRTSHGWRSGVKEGGMMLHGVVFHRRRRHGCFARDHVGFVWRHIFWYEIYRDRRM